MINAGCILQFLAHNDKSRLDFNGLTLVYAIQQLTRSTFLPVPDINISNVPNKAFIT